MRVSETNDVTISPGPFAWQATQQAARHEAIRVAKEREAQRQLALKRRKQQNASFRKKTKTGQPVMSVRVNKILSRLEVAA